MRARSAVRRLGAPPLSWNLRPTERPCLSSLPPVRSFSPAGHLRSRTPLWRRAGRFQHRAMVERNPSGTPRCYPVAVEGHEIGGTLGMAVFASDLDIGDVTQKEIIVRRGKGRKRRSVPTDPAIWRVAAAYPPGSGPHLFGMARDLGEGSRATPSGTRSSGQASWLAWILGAISSVTASGRTYSRPPGARASSKCATARAFGSTGYQSVCESGRVAPITPCSRAIARSSASAFTRPLGDPDPERCASPPTGRRHRMPGRGHCPRSGHSAKFEWT